MSYLDGAPARGFLRTSMTESPRRNILEINLSLLTGLLCWDQIALRNRHYLKSLLCYLLFSLARPWNFCPHFFHIFQNHITMSVEGFNTSQKFLVIPTVDQHLCVVLDRLGKHWKRTSIKFFLFSFSQFLWSHLRLGFVDNSPSKSISHYNERNKGKSDIFYAICEPTNNFVVTLQMEKY